MFVLLVLACASTPPISDERPAPRRTFGLDATRMRATWRAPAWSNALPSADAWPIASNQLFELEPPPPSPPGNTPSVLAQIGASIQGADLLDDRGADLQERLAEDPARAAKYGVASLTMEEVWGTETEPGLCEPLGLSFELDEGGVTYEGVADIEPYFQHGGDPAPIFQTLSSTCSNALLETKGDVALAESSGDCSIYEIQQWFLEGSACRACVEETDGDFAACESSGECPEETVAQNYTDFEDVGRVWYRSFQGVLLACAPQHVTPYWMLARTPSDDELPVAFDHTSLGALCIWFTNPDSGEVEMGCYTGVALPDRSDALGEGGLVHLSYIREAGSSETPHEGRIGYFARVDFWNGNWIRWMNLSSWGGAGILSLPSLPVDLDGDGTVGPGDWGFDYPEGGVGLNPYALRPDGTDPTNPDDTLARDWLGADALKTATTISGIFVTYINHNVCADDGWLGPDAAGVSYCAERGESQLGWLNDAENIWIDEEMTATQPFPHVTLASTGLPDPAVPGGLAVHVAGSTSLANPAWEGCTWPDSFTPDLVPVAADPFEPDGPTPLTAETWRFDAHVDRDFRVVLATNQLRGFCPEG